MLKPLVRHCTRKVVKTIEAKHAERVLKLIHDNTAITQRSNRHFRENVALKTTISRKDAHITWLKKKLKEKNEELDKTTVALCSRNQQVQDQVKEIKSLRKNVHDKELRWG